MKMSIKSPITGKNAGYAKKTDYEFNGLPYKADLQTGDIVTILNDGKPETQNGETRVFFNLATRNGTKKAPFNQPTINALITAFGDESKKWVNKEVKVKITPATINGVASLPTFFYPVNA
jgi:hypothetical protein